MPREQLDPIEHLHDSAIFSLAEESARHVRPFTICKENGHAGLWAGPLSVLDVGLSLFVVLGMAAGLISP